MTKTINIITVLYFFKVKKMVSLGKGLGKIIALLVIAVVIGALAPTIFSTLGLVNTTGWSPIAISLFYVVSIAIALGLIIVVLEVVGIKVTSD